MFSYSITNGSTVKALDKYIASGEQYFFITDTFNITYNQKVYRINFIISNKIEIGKSIVQTNITMTEFKKIYSSYTNNLDTYINYKNLLTDKDRTFVPKFSTPVLDFIELFFNHFKRHFKSINKTNKNIIFFDNPISINAQSSNNRIGYGNQYYCDILVYEGTKFEIKK